MNNICELCGKPIKYYEKRLLTGAIRTITNAETVCEDCQRTAESIDWTTVARNAIKEARK